MKTYLNKLYLDYITSTEEKKKKIKLFLSFWLFLIIWLVIFWLYYKSTDTFTVEPIKNTTETNTTVEETTSVNWNIWVQTDEQIKTSYLTNKELDTEIFTSENDVKENYDLKQKIEVSGEEELGEIIVMFLKTSQLVQDDIKNLNWYLSKIKQEGLKTNCKEKKCTLDEKLSIYDELSNYNQKLLQQKNQVTSSLSTIWTFNSLSEYKISLDQWNMCSDSDIISNYLIKLRISWEKKTDLDRLREFKDKYLSDSQMINYTLKIDTLLSEKIVELNISDFSLVKTSKLKNYTINIGTENIKIDYYDYNWQLFEKTIIDNLSDESKNEVIKITKINNFVYLFWPQYIQTNEWKVKVYIPKLVLLKDKWIFDTLSYIYLASMKDNCNIKPNLSFRNYDEDIIKKNLIIKYIDNYKTEKSLVTTWQISIDNAKDVSLLLKEYELLMWTVFIY